MTIQEKLERLHRRGTAYELTAKMPNGKSYLVGYCQHGKLNILNMLRKNGEKWATRIKAEDQITFAKNGRSAIMGEIEIRFTGRTQRDAIICGEYPWFEEIPII